MSPGDDPALEKATTRAVATAIPAIVAALRGVGVIGVQWFLAFGGEPIIWLVTATDADKTSLLDHGLFVDQVRALLGEAGVRADLATRAGVTAESQETVDRDFDGKWHYAMR